MLRRSSFVGIILLFGFLVANLEAQDVLKVGDKAPNFEIQSISGESVSLSQFTSDGKSVVLVFSRANW